MPKLRPPVSGYARIAQDEEHTGRDSVDDSDDENTFRGPSKAFASPGSIPRYAAITTQPRVAEHPPDLANNLNSRRSNPRLGRVRRSSSGVDIKAINARLERWAEEIASKFKIGKVRGKSDEEEHLEIHHSVFQAPDGVRPATAETLATESDPGIVKRPTKIDFDDIVESVRIAIENGIHPKMISQGSSGSYFARDSDGRIVGVFKPKDEEPYASRNPKWTKWIHRNLFPCCFGRACLIPNLSYVSEAAAYVLDTRLRTNLVPYTDIVYLSSRSFYYDLWDRRNFYRKHKQFPPKIGSFQVFLKGFKDANIFLREHPWPEQPNPSFRPQARQPKSKRSWNDTCRPKTGGVDGDDDSDTELEVPEEPDSRPRFVWTEGLQRSFREELEKLVVLDYIMRNTDRGLDNWMIKIDWSSQKVSIVSDPPRTNGHVGADGDDDDEYRNARPVQAEASASLQTERSDPYRLQQPMEATSRSTTPTGRAQAPTIALGAIDNSLSWPWKHPDAWRSFPFGWLFLPVSLIGQPFSQRTRDHFLPLLTSKAWWSETQTALRRVFSQDSDFKERMFARQIAVMKGQAWNVVETLKTVDHGPLELTRRTRVCVWDDLVDIPVAVPMRVASAEMRRVRDMDLQRSVAEEMDISAANSTAPLSQHDLLGLAGSSSDMPSVNRFSLSSDGRDADATSAQVAGEDLQSPASPSSTENLTFGRHVKPVIGLEGQPRQSLPPSVHRTHPTTRMSFDGPSRHRRKDSNARARRFSFGGRQGSVDSGYGGDDLEGDLGYAAAEDMEKNRRKVIVERLETVQSKNPTEVRGKIVELELFKASSECNYENVVRGSLG
ncbi:MAG: hypothetical protein M1825_000581 [Sarcosagium campestre]|nr:MAG: hypothetical protein M1825_000581 [Sarcosagium campestre]